MRPRPRAAACRVVIADDHQMFAEGLARVIDATDDLEVIAIVGSLAGLSALTDGDGPDVVLLDDRLPDGRGADAVPELRLRWIDTAFIVLTGYASDYTRQRTRSAGCDALIEKTAAVTEIPRLIREVHDGTYQAPRIITSGGMPRLTPRELEVLALLAEGLAPTDIAARLFVSLTTTRNHIQRILGKLGAASQLEAVVIGIREGLVPSP